VGLVGLVDMGWKDLRIDLDVDGDHHRRDSKQYVKDQRTMRRLEQQARIVISCSSTRPASQTFLRTDKALWHAVFASEPRLAG